MSLSYIPYTLWQQIPFGDPDAFIDWNAQHFMIHQVLASRTITSLVPLDSIRDDPFPHGNMHKDLSAAFGLPITWDFSDYDLSDRDGYYEFMLAHSAHHQQLEQAGGF